MDTLITNKLDQLYDICRKHNVKSLYVFGSAARKDFESRTSDLDFLVTFRPMKPTEHADCFFGLIEDLEELFNVPVDLVEESTIKNPYFHDAVSRTRVQIYDAA